MSVFLGIGLGPIQTGIFIPGARRAGFDRSEQVGIERLNEMYFDGRADGLRLSPSGVGTLLSAWV